MADPRFFQKSRTFSVGEMAEMLSCDVAANANADLELTDVAPLQTAGPDQLSFLDNVKYKDDFLTTKAGACFVSPDIAAHAPENVICLVTDTPYKAYALAAQQFYPKDAPGKSVIEKTAQIDKGAKIGKGVTIGHHVVIGANAEIGDESWIEANTVIGDNVIIGAGCRVGPNATVSHAIIGDDVRLYPGVRIGQDGFGFAIDPEGHVKVPQLGRVLIEDHVEIGANTTIDRGAGPDTVIGQGTWIDNLGANWA